MTEKAPDELSVYDLLGISDITTPDTPEEKFYHHLTGGNAPRIDNMLHFLKHEIEHYRHLVENGVTMNITADVYTKLMMKYYLQMMHLSRFVYELHNDDGSELPKLDLDKAVALFLSHPGVQKIITAAKDTA